MNFFTRRDFLRSSALAALCSAPCLHAEHDAFIRERRVRTLRYIEAMRFKDGAYGRYRYSADMPEPTLYSSTYAAMTRSLYRDLDSLTKTQREEWIAYLPSHQDDDGFGQGVHGPRSSACEDIDSIDPLARLLKTSPQRATTEKALARAEDHMWAQQNDDGGLTWIRGTKFQYGHPLLAAPVDGSGMFPTWFRTLALAYLGKALPTARTGAFDWHFAQCPGIQFYHP